MAVLLHKEYGNETESDPNLLENDDDEEVKQLPEFTKDEVITLTNTKFSSSSSSSSSSSKISVAHSAVSSRGTLDIKERMTTPPTYLTESELITRMERHGIGTDASISTHIENVLKRNYAELLPGRKIAPSKLGLVLAQGYHSIDSSLVLPQIRSDIEDQCAKIGKGLIEKVSQAKFKHYSAIHMLGYIYSQYFAHEYNFIFLSKSSLQDQVVEKAINIFENKFMNFVENINKMDILFGSSFTQLENVGKPYTRCGFTRYVMCHLSLYNSKNPIFMIRINPKLFLSCLHFFCLGDTSNTLKDLLLASTTSLLRLCILFLPVES